MRSFAFLLLLALFGGCGDSETRATTTTGVDCSATKACDEIRSCLNGHCVADGSVAEGEQCAEHRQCEAGFSCFGGECNPGCVELFTIRGCQDGYWCDQVSGAVGECLRSHCDPSQSSRCGEGGVCAAMAYDVGACMSGCEYGFVGGVLQDSCDPDGTTHESCQPMGLNEVPACMRAGWQSSPDVGETGCDTVTNPCKAGGICVALVCRRLCRDGIPGICATGEDCKSYGDNDAFQYCAGS